ncbi:MAG TPA: hydantoinase/oxoprolinase family protein [Anaerolineae bacterium]|nr:hydantoinase/oxoprolinase family protein [Anaerolineae bacterium]
MQTSTESHLVLGIDTGGTYTDGVLLEYETRRVVASHKSLTTKRDFSIGIENVIEGIQIEDPADIRMVSISTTLATNAIAEGVEPSIRGKRVALVLIGYDPDLISTFKMEGRFSTPNYYFFDGGHDLYGREKKELDLPNILAKVSEIKDQVDAIAVSSYFSPLNPEHENRAYRAISSICDLPIVLGHQLSTRLGSVERATTAALNASLLAVLQDFVIAVRRAMERRTIDAPLMVVRGDGTLMSDEFAARTPVETIHSGPAASAIGGRFLSRLDNALILDVGGTTTDIALIEGGQVAVSEQGATVSEFKTSVKAANLLSIALGGDSHITWGREKEIVVGPERVTPLAYLAWKHPHVAKQVKAVSMRTWAQATPDWLEYWFLLREPQASLLKSTRDRELVDLLRDGPRPVPEILKGLNILHVGQAGVQELLRQEVIGKAGLTFTDLMHIEGRYDVWDADTSLCAWKVFCQFQFRDPDELRQQAWTQATEMIVHAILTFLSERPLRLSDRQRSLEGADDDIGRWFFYNSLYQAHPHLETTIRLRQPIIGIGAPASIFLPDVAKALHTELILPEYHEVANAVGAIAGSVMVEEELLIYPKLSRDGLEVFGYYVAVPAAEPTGSAEAGDLRYEYEELHEALAHARKLSHERALGAAIRSGADNPEVTIEELTDGLDTFRIRAKAIGNPRLTR